MSIIKFEKYNNPEYGSREWIVRGKTTLDEILESLIDKESEEYLSMYPKDERIVNFEKYKPVK